MSVVHLGYMYLLLCLRWSTPPFWLASREISTYTDTTPSSEALVRFFEILFRYHKINTQILDLRLGSLKYTDSFSSAPCMQATQRQRRSAIPCHALLACYRRRTLSTKFVATNGSRNNTKLITNCTIGGVKPMVHNNFRKFTL